MRAVGTFGLAKKDVSGENKKKKKRTKKKEGLVGRAEEEGEEGEGGPRRRVEEGEAYGGHHPAKGEQTATKSEGFTHTRTHAPHPRFCRSRIHGWTEARW